MRALTFGLLLPTPLPHGFKLILAAERQVLHLYILIMSTAAQPSHGSLIFMTS